jgi:hypothetical protein
MTPITLAELRTLPQGHYVEYNGSDILGSGVSSSANAQRKQNQNARQCSSQQFIHERPFTREPTPLPLPLPFTLPRPAFRKQVVAPIDSGKRPLVSVHFIYSSHPRQRSLQPKSEEKPVKAVLPSFPERARDNGVSCQLLSTRSRFSYPPG